ncbi:uncharacterized protein LOC120890843 [Ictidomys tridecemlineatus]|uniref:synaptojanin-1-like n=1 Tax=Ictidomys tridecemlineatus TaxID=43179 RepID=UPI001A9E9048|nr:synaptojanin-1-like [Ictidomys tridecemlineatus]XP_040144959.1 synaptojanin-1-like [Ictidomys tridecemlineatus]
MLRALAQRNLARKEDGATGFGRGGEAKVRPCSGKRQLLLDSPKSKEAQGKLCGFSGGTPLWDLSRRSFSVLGLPPAVLPSPVPPPRPSPGPLGLSPPSLEKSEGAPCRPEAAGAATRSRFPPPSPRGPARTLLDPPGSPGLGTC